jgi:hypothetical protein
VTLSVIIHEETHLHTRDKLGRIAAKWREARTQGDTRPFAHWIRDAHAVRLVVAGIRIDDETWLTLREMIGDLTYVGVREPRPLGECRGSFNGFTSVFHNFDINALQLDGRDYEVEVFGEIDYCAEHWEGAPTWNNEIPGFAERLLAEWREYVKALPPLHRREVVARAMAKGEQSPFYAELLVGL